LIRAINGIPATHDEGTSKPSHPDGV